MARGGKFYGVGVGPGDPGLVTLRAVEVLGRVDVVFAARSATRTGSTALGVVRAMVGGQARVVELDFPMTREMDVLEQAWDANAKMVAKVLEQGQDAAFVTMGDPLTYSTYTYLLRSLLRIAPWVEVETVPGVSAYQAAAARLNLPLAEGKGALVVASGEDEPSRITRFVEQAQSVAVMKPYRRTAVIVEALKTIEPRPGVVGALRVGLKGERLVLDGYSLGQRQMPYLGLLLVRRQGW